MAKNLKLKIKNTQLAKAAGFAKKPAPKKGEKPKKAPPPEKTPPPEEEGEEKPRRIRAKSKSSFAPTEEMKTPPPVEEKTRELTPQAHVEATAKPTTPKKVEEKEEKLGPTGRHVNDLLAKAKKPAPKPKEEGKTKTEQQTPPPKKELKKGKKVREFKDLKPARKQGRGFDSRNRAGLHAGEDDSRWRKRRGQKQAPISREEQIDRPTTLKIRLPITIKELAVEMKLKSAEIIQKLFLAGMVYTVNDLAEDETTIQYVGNEFGCEISVDTSEEERLQITAQSVREEIKDTEPAKLHIRPPVVAFMGHVDHGKTSLIDAIRESNITAGEAGAITQHIGAFRCKTAVGNLTILDTPGHEAFSAMRARGADVTDIVVLVVAGDEGLKEQTVEAIQHAKAAEVTIVVAINKCDKPNFNSENVLRELSLHELLPESWGGSTITVNTSAISGEGIPELLEMLALQAEVLELKANPDARARGSVLESELHKGMGNVTTLLVQNGTLKYGDAIVFESQWGKVKTMQNELGKPLEEAGPSSPVEITGLSGLPSAGDPFIVVESEKEAQDIVQARVAGIKTRMLQQRKTPSFETLLQEGTGAKKVLKLILRADVQGSLEALKTSIEKIESDKAEADIIFTSVGDISESDIQLAAASNAIILGFHTRIESHAEPLIKELGVTVSLFDVIYHAIDGVKSLMLGLLDKIAEERDTGKAEVTATFKSSQLGIIAGCMVLDGVINRNHKMRLFREGKEIWRGSIASIKREKEEVKEVKKGFECGILLEGFKQIQEGDILQAYEIHYLAQEL
ncbi:MAG: Translation initiation factor IF-2 [Chlamydiae bacterium]|nr:Translation initiation factor IF-2 [Chlamydiota bacterium]